MNGPDNKNPGTPAKTEPAESERDEVRGGWPREIGGPRGPEPTRFGDWEKGGRCVDF